MSGALPTSAQPAFHPANVVAHPGSTAAGVGTLAIVFGQSLANGAPTSGWGWLLFALQLAGSAGAVLGK